MARSAPLRQCVGILSTRDMENGQPFRCGLCDTPLFNTTIPSEHFNGHVMISHLIPADHKVFVDDPHNRQDISEAQYPY